MDIPKLKEEINSDPLGRGYSAMDDAAVAASLNTADRSRVVELSSAKLLAWSAGASAGDRPRLIKIDEASQSHASEEVKAAALISAEMVRRDGTSIDLNLADHMGLLDGLVAGGVLSSADKTDLLQLATESISRATELGLGLVRPGDVIQARM